MVYPRFGEHEVICWNCAFSATADGAGNFVLHLNGKIYDARCEKGDLISVPAGTKHWFDAGEKPSFVAVRVFTDTSGWVAHFTGDDISNRFPAVV